jgi:chitodextrinase
MHTSNIQFIKILRIVLVSSIVAALGGITFFQISAAGSTHYVSINGSDSADGSRDAPWRTIQKGITSLTPGSTLIVSGGTYDERIQNPSVSTGTALNRITVKAAAGEKPVISGLLWMSSASYWTFDGINVTWSARNTGAEHMMKFTSGTGWRITNAEIWGARSYAGILVAGSPSGWSIDHNYIHDTYKTNSANQDHLIYVNGGMGGGTITRNIFANSANGRGVKIGPPSSSSSPIGNVTISYNTFYNNTGPSNIQLSFGATGNKIYRNLMVKSGKTNVTAYNLNGKDNVAYDNVGWDSSAILDSADGLADKGGNVHADPQLDTDTYRPRNSTYSNYGRYAAGDDSNGSAPTPTPTPTPSTEDETPPTVPSGLQASAGDSTRVVVSWKPSTDTVGVKGYTLYRGTTAIKLGNVTDYQDSNLKPGTTYTYQIVAFDTAGNNSDKSSAVSVTTSVATPSTDTTPPVVTITAPKPNVVVTGNVTISITATDASDIAKIELRIDGVLVATKTASSYTHIWNTAGLVGPHTIEARAVDNAGNAAISSASVITNTTTVISTQVPTPSGLTATVVSDGQINLAWNAINTYRVDIYRDGTKIGSNSSDAKYGDTYKIVAGETYSYYIVGRDSEGRISGKSNTVAVSTGGSSATPQPSANNGTLTGKISDNNGKPIAGAKVSLKVAGKTVSAIANNSGIYTLSSIPAESYEIVYSANGFKTKNDNVTVLAATVKNKNVTLFK